MSSESKKLSNDELSEIFNEAYEEVKSTIDGDNFSILGIIDLIIDCMRAIKKYKRLDGNQKRDTVLRIAKKYTNEDAPLSDKDRNKASEIIDSIGPEIVNGLYWAGKQSKKIFKDSGCKCCIL